MTIELQKSVKYQYRCLQTLLLLLYSLIDSSKQYESQLKCIEAIEQKIDAQM